ncbi:leucine-rich repeat flightless-interacting protein 2 isoform X1 [Myzus persicae]|uniref:leucine-rich repeat flightless-interacting protein 2 isoform X1 n=1 Tax=Myzus persicae TaxID=13164 RepID=UPI000B932A35|nr:leucine-rich repeat flightless-interacting protein 2 isoform X1 [Myzus persicae]
MQNDSHIKMNVTSCDLITGAHITHIYINQTQDNLNEKSLDTKLLVNEPIELNTSNSTFAPKESSSLYSSSINDCRDAAVNILNNETPYEYSKVVQSSQLILDNNGSYSCHICVNDKTALNSMRKTINTDSIRPVYNSDTNYIYPSSEDDESYCGYSIADISDIDELSDSILNDRQSSPLWEHTKVQTNGSSHGYNYCGDSEAGGIVTFLDKRNNEAEARLAARRQARAEAREIRMREIERQQKEAEENADKAFDMHAADGTIANRVSRVAASTASPRAASSIHNTNSYQSSRRNSVDSLDESTPNFRDFRMELKDLEEKFRKAMVQNAQLDNEKAAVTYMVELYKDKYTDIEEELMHIKREHKESCRENEKLKRLLATQKLESITLQQELEERDKLIEEKGLVIISTEQEFSSESDQCNSKIKRALVSVENAQLLQDAGEGCLDVRLKKFTEERNSYIDEINQLKLELQEAKRHSDNHYNGTDSDDLEDAQKETNKVLGDYKFKWQKAEQDISTLQANVARLESQVIRYKTASEASEKAEDELKLEKRKLQRELREAQAKVEELETSNMHLLKRFDKLKNAKSSLLKDL